MCLSCFKTKNISRCIISKTRYISPINHRECFSLTSSYWMAKMRKNIYGSDWSTISEPILKS
ncbi:hypothetical protein FHG68_15865 [Leptospira weilii]|nr:hypothetical protein FHG67_15815 [Leptospira weilii]QDK27978.1 hypothetical protein FHG68_15865 [Leptospira weilii]